MKIFAVNREPIRYKTTVIAIPGNITLLRFKILPDGKSNPFGKTFIMGHIILAGIEKGIHQNFPTAHMLANNKLLTILRITEINIFI
ncbi:hypothetical protein bsdcttw_40880 [Anaerocolumna chitinilytica]|uniref:Uncharacterized protein n=1 Tax=Anaerocolumna chitinilytica TaxID=1727145 RepID=A0A7I8DTL0_9FIRM|nr:hypothetical protein bsdcttw_40880 [Anaerocolumna chitinilytica]